MVKKNVPVITDPEIREKSRKVFIKQVDKTNISELTSNAYSVSSSLAMASDWNRFIAFCDTRHVQPLPASVTAIRLFLEQESRERKFSSIRRYSITVGNIHVLHGYPDPTSHRQIRFTLAQLQAQKSGDARQANAMTNQHLADLTDLLVKDASVRASRDLAIYYLMFECALKRSDLKNLTMECICEQDDILTISLNDADYRLSRQGSAALTRWIRYLLGSQGYLFRRIDRHQNIGTDRLDDSSIYRILRRASDLLGLDHEHRFTGQSARVGAAQELEKQGYQLRDIQDFGRWLSPAMPAQYLSRTSLARGEMAKYKTIKPWS